MKVCVFFFFSAAGGLMLQTQINFLIICIVALKDRFLYKATFLFLIFFKSCVLAISYM